MKTSIMMWVMTLMLTSLMTSMPTMTLTFSAMSRGDVVDKEDGDLDGMMTSMIMIKMMSMISSMVTTS